MVRFEDNSLLHLLSLQSVVCTTYKFVLEITIKPRDGLLVEAVLSTTKFAGGRVIKPRDGLRRGSYQGDGRRGKVWSRGGQDDGISLSDTG